MRSGDTVARLGGDEFAIIQSSDNQPQDAGALSRRIIEIVKQPFQVEGHDLHVGVSIGVAFPDHADDPDKLLKNADIALYRAKQGGTRKRTLSSNRRWISSSRPGRRSSTIFGRRC